MTSAEKKTVVERAAGLSDEVLESVETGRRAAIAAVRKFVDTVDEVTPALIDPSRRKTIVDAALDLADSLVTTRMEFLRSVVRSASETVSSGVLCGRSATNYGKAVRAAATPLGYLQRQRRATNARHEVGRIRK